MKRFFALILTVVMMVSTLSVAIAVPAMNDTQTNSTAVPEFDENAEVQPDPSPCAAPHTIYFNIAYVDGGYPDYDDATHWKVSYNCQYQYCDGTGATHFISFTDIGKQLSTAKSKCKSGFEVAGWCKDLYASPIRIFTYYSGSGSSGSTMTQGTDADYSTVIYFVAYPKSTEPTSAPTTAPDPANPSTHYATFNVLYVDVVGGQYHVNETTKWQAIYTCVYHCNGSGEEHGVPFSTVGAQLQSAKSLLPEDWKIIGFTTAVSAYPSPIYTTYTGSSFTTCINVGGSGSDGSTVIYFVATENGQPIPDPNATPTPSTDPTAGPTFGPTAEPDYYTVKFVEPTQGRVIDSCMVKPGESAIAPELYSMDAFYDQIFTGWDKSFENVHENLTITAVTWLIGDANFDGVVNTGDATLILRYCAETADFERKQTIVSDATLDGKVNTGDATFVLQYCAGNLMHFTNDWQ